MKKNKQQLIEYVSINHYFMTLSEMAEETETTAEFIKRICDENEWKPITIKERMKEFIESNQHLSFDEQCAKLKTSDATLRYHYEKLGIPIPTRKLGRKAFIEKEKIDDMKEILEQRAKKTAIDRKAFTTYTQTGSDLLDKYRGIKTTDRNDKLLL